MGSTVGGPHRGSDMVSFQDLKHPITKFVPPPEWHSKYEKLPWKAPFLHDLSSFTRALWEKDVPVEFQNRTNEHLKHPILTERQKALIDHDIENLAKEGTIHRTQSTAPILWAGYLRCHNRNSETAYYVVDSYGISAYTDSRRLKKVLHLQFKTILDIRPVDPERMDRKCRIMRALIDKSFITLLREGDIDVSPLALDLDAVKNEIKRNPRGAGDFKYWRGTVADTVVGSNNQRPTGADNSHLESNFNPDPDLPSEAELVERAALTQLTWEEKLVLILRDDVFNDVGTERLFEVLGLSESFFTTRHAMETQAEVERQERLPKEKLGGRGRRAWKARELIEKERGIMGSQLVDSSPKGSSDQEGDYYGGNSNDMTSSKRSSKSGALSNANEVEQHRSLLNALSTEKKYSLSTLKKYAFLAQGSNLNKINGIDVRKSNLLVTQLKTQKDIELENEIFLADLEDAGFGSGPSAKKNTTKNSDSINSTLFYEGDSSGSESDEEKQLPRNSEKESPSRGQNSSSKNSQTSIRNSSLNQGKTSQGSLRGPSQTSRGGSEGKSGSQNASSRGSSRNEGSKRSSSRSGSKTNVKAGVNTSNNANNNDNRTSNTTKTVTPNLNQGTADSRNLSANLDSIYEDEVLNNADFDSNVILEKRIIPPSVTQLLGKERGSLEAELSDSLASISGSRGDSAGSQSAVSVIGNVHNLRLKDRMTEFKRRRKSRTPWVTRMDSLPRAYGPEKLGPSAKQMFRHDSMTRFGIDKVNGYDLFQMAKTYYPAREKDIDYELKKIYNSEITRDEVKKGIMATGLHKVTSRYLMNSFGDTSLFLRHQNLGHIHRQLAGAADADDPNMTSLKKLLQAHVAIEKRSRQLEVESTHSYNDVYRRKSFITTLLPFVNDTGYDERTCINSEILQRAQNSRQATGNQARDFQAYGASGDLLARLFGAYRDSRSPNYHDMFFDAKGRVLQAILKRKPTENELELEDEDAYDTIVSHEAAGDRLRRYNELVRRKEELLALTDANNAAGADGDAATTVGSGSNTINAGSSVRKTGAGSVAVPNDNAHSSSENDIQIKHIDRQLKDLQDEYLEHESERAKRHVKLFSLKLWKAKNATEAKFRVLGQKQGSASQWVRKDYNLGAFADFVKEDTTLLDQFKGRDELTQDEYDHLLLKAVHKEHRTLQRALDHPDGADAQSGAVATVGRVIGHLLVSPQTGELDIHSLDRLAAETNKTATSGVRNAHKKTQELLQGVREDIDSGHRAEGRSGHINGSMFKMDIQGLADEWDDYGLNQSKEDSDSTHVRKMVDINRGLKGSKNQKFDLLVDKNFKAGKYRMVQPSVIEALVKRFPDLTPQCLVRLTHGGHSETSTGRKAKVTKNALIKALEEYEEPTDNEPKFESVLDRIRKKKQALKAIVALTHSTAAGLVSRPTNKSENINDDIDVNDNSVRTGKGPNLFYQDEEKFLKSAKFQTQGFKKSSATEGAHVRESPFGDLISGGKASTVNSSSSVSGDESQSTSSSGGWTEKSKMMETPENIGAFFRQQREYNAGDDEISYHVMSDIFNLAPKNLAEHRRYRMSRYHLTMTDVELNCSDWSHTIAIDCKADLSDDTIHTVYLQVPGISPDIPSKTNEFGYEISAEDEEKILAENELMNVGDPDMMALGINHRLKGAVAASAKMAEEKMHFQHALDRSMRVLKDALLDKHSHLVEARRKKLEFNPAIPKDKEVRQRNPAFRFFLYGEMARKMDTALGMYRMISVNKLSNLYEQGKNAQCLISGWLKIRIPILQGKSLKISKNDSKACATADVPRFVVLDRYAGITWYSVCPDRSNRIFPKPLGNINLRVLLQTFREVTKAKTGQVMPDEESKVGEKDEHELTVEKLNREFWEAQDSGKLDDSAFLEPCQNTNMCPLKAMAVPFERAKRYLPDAIAKTWYDYSALKRHNFRKKYGTRERDTENIKELLNEQGREVIENLENPFKPAQIPGLLPELKESHNPLRYATDSNYIAEPMEAQAEGTTQPKLNEWGSIERAMFLQNPNLGAVFYVRLMNSSQVVPGFILSVQDLVHHEGFKPWADRMSLYCGIPFYFYGHDFSHTDDVDVFERYNPEQEATMANGGRGWGLRGAAHGLREHE